MTMAEHKPTSEPDLEADPFAATEGEPAAQGDDSNDREEVIAMQDFAPADRFAFNDHPYVFDAVHLAVAAELLSAARRPGHSEAEHLRRVAQDLGLADDMAPLVRELWLALNYHLTVQHHGKPAGCELGPATVGDDHSWPPSPPEVSADVRSLWQSLAGDAGLPAAIAARLNDLLVVSRIASPQVHARAAAEAYLADATRGPDQDLDATASLVRAWDLSRRFKLEVVEAAAVNAMLDYATVGLDAGPNRPGVVVPVLCACAAALHPTRETTLHEANAHRLDVLLQRSMATYRRDYLVSEIAQLMRQRTPDAEAIDAINRSEVQSRLDLADASPSVAVRMHFLHAAAGLARDLGVEDMRAEAVRLLQRIKPAELELKRVAVAGRLPRDSVEEYLDQYTISPDWRDGVMAFLHSDPPTGNLERLRDTTADLNRVAVLRRLFPVVVLGPDGLPVVEADSDADKDDHDLAGVAKQHAVSFGRLLAEGLYRVGTRYGAPDRKDLSLLLANNGRGDPVLSDRLARAFELYWAGDYSSCVHVAAPLAEAAARALLRTLDEAIYRTHKPQVRGGYVGLYALIDALQRLDLDPSWAFYLKWLLVSPYGPNLRNSIAHGFGGGDNPLDAALVLRGVGLLVWILPAPEAIEAAPDEDVFRSELRGLLSEPVEDPVPWPASPPLPARLLLWGSRLLERWARRIR
jgi:hypothetical protein